MAERIDIMDAPKESPSFGSQEVDNDYLLVEKLKKEGIKQSKHIKEKWPTYRKYYKGAQYDKNRPAYKMQEVYNICREVIQSILPIWTDSKPGFNVGPRTPQDHLFAQKISALVESLWKRLNMQMRMAETIQEAMTVGTGIMSVLWDTSLDDGNGDINLEVIDPDNIIVPSSAVDFDRNCPWVIEKKRMRVSELKIKYPDMADKIKADDVGEEDDEGEQPHKQKPVDTVDKSDNFSNFGQKVDDGTVEVNLCWIDAQYVDEYVSEGEVNEDGSPVVDEDGEQKLINKKKYPDGKVIITCPNIKLRLDTINNPYKDAYPFVAEGS